MRRRFLRLNSGITRNEKTARLPTTGKQIRCDLNLKLFLYSTLDHARLIHKCAIRCNISGVVILGKCQLSLESSFLRNSYNRYCRCFGYCSRLSVMQWQVQVVRRIMMWGRGFFVLSLIWVSVEWGARPFLAPWESKFSFTHPPR